MRTAREGSGLEPSCALLFFATEFTVSTRAHDRIDAAARTTKRLVAKNHTQSHTRNHKSEHHEGDECIGEKHTCFFLCPSRFAAL